MTRLQLASDLVTEALLFMERRLERIAPALAAEWHAEREQLYELPAGSARERAFAELDRRWVTRLDLAAPLERALQVCPCILARVEAVVVRRARSARDEGAELLVPRAGSTGRGTAPPAARVVMGLRAASLADATVLSELALVELLRVEDMLDPRFGFRPDPSLGLELEPWQRELVRDRLAVLWDARALGRARRALGGGEDDPGPSGAFSKAFARAEAEWVRGLHGRAWGGELDTFDALVSAASGAPAHADRGGAG